MDALHVASAIISGADWMLTTDRALLEKCRLIRAFGLQTRWISFAKLKEDTMKPDFEVRLDGMKALVHALGPVEAERFITLLNREKLDYTEWRKQQWLDETVASLAEKARALRKANNAH